MKIMEISVFELFWPQKWPFLSPFGHFWAFSGFGKKRGLFGLKIIRFYPFWTELKPLKIGGFGPLKSTKIRWFQESHKVVILIILGQTPYSLPSNLWVLSFRPKVTKSGQKGSNRGQKGVKVLKSHENHAKSGFNPSNSCSRGCKSKGVKMRVPF